MLLNAIQIIASLILIVLILLQEKSTGLGGLFGGDNLAPYQTRRGLEKIVFFATIAVAAIWGALAAIIILVK